MKNEELMMKLTEFLNKVYFLNALNGSLFLNSSLIIHNCLSSSLITHNLDLFKNNFFNAEKLLKRVMVFSFVLKKING